MSLEDRMSLLYGGPWEEVHGADTSERAEQGGQEGEIGWWSPDPRLRPRHTRIVSCSPVAFSTLADCLQSQTQTVIDQPRHYRRAYPRLADIGPSPDIVTRNPLPPSRLPDADLERIPFEPFTSLDNISTSDRYRSLRRNQSRMYRTLLSRRPQPNDRPSRPHPADGLGDRDRSLSPEGWDTLRSTLTPDPQPPSAGTSFASAAATQGAGPSNRPPTAPELPGGTTDPACESSHENSDDEDTYSGYPGYRGIRNAHRRIRQLVPEYNLDGPSDGRRSQQTQTSRPSGDVLANHYSQLLFSQTSHTGSEDERRLDRLRLTREESSGSGPGTLTGDEEWVGMQRIVRNLAAREDIPDEWWTGAGLNRTLPREGSN